MSQNYDAIIVLSYSNDNYIVGIGSLCVFGRNADYARCVSLETSECVFDSHPDSQQWDVAACFGEISCTFLNWINPNHSRNMVQCICDNN